VQIIIPMSGFGERFRRAGYSCPKPLIEIEGKPIIAHVIDMFPQENDFIFICNQEHLDNPNYHMAKIIYKYCPTGKILGIAPHNLGPVHAVLQAKNLIKIDSPVIVNYCDFTCYWNWADFKNYVAKTACAGAIPAYKGFHPHTLGSTNYAYMLEVDGVVQDIQEKQPYTNNRMEEFASSGTYYFSSGKLLLEAFATTVAKNLSLNGEYYVSLAYKYLLATQQKVLVYPLQYFMQWGTPEDVAEYNSWSHAFRKLIHTSQNRHIYSDMAVIIPMSGLGQRFADENYRLPKPLIPVSGKSMVIQATNTLPLTQNYVFVLRKDMPGYFEISTELQDTYPNAIIETVSSVTEGQACTALLGLDALERAQGKWNGSITFGACDYGALYDDQYFQALLNDLEVDVIVWGVRGYANAIRHPHMYGWIDEEHGLIKSISVKKPLQSPARDPIVLGSFTFRRADDFRNVYAKLRARDGRINNEFYLDACINDAIAQGLKCYLFEVDSFLSWGTPNDLKTFEYWQSCFHKWASHPYNLALDATMVEDKINVEA
jgi:NDP-sugar pyrophosphorylase family protein